MKNKFLPAGICAVLFVLLIVLVKAVNVAAIGPEHTEIGMSALNGAFHDLTGVHMALYKITDYLGYLAIATVLAFAAIGALQLIKSRSIFQVDVEILLLGALFVAVAVLYVLFEVVVINYRPVIMPGDLHVEASFPSSHTMLACVTLGGEMMILKNYIRNPKLLFWLTIAAAAVIAITVIGRLICGVHWFTDILGGLLISGALLFVFAGVLDMVNQPVRGGKHLKK